MTLLLKLKFKEVNYSCQDYLAYSDNEPVHIEHFKYEVEGEGTKGVAFCHHISYEFDPDETGSTPIQFRGYMHFEGTFNNYQGSFLAQEDGVCNPSGRKTRGTIVDADDELVMMTGSFEYHFDTPLCFDKDQKAQTDRTRDKEVEVFFDIDL